MFIDVWSGRMVGWTVGERMTADLLQSALKMAQGVIKQMTKVV